MGFALTTLSTIFARQNPLFCLKQLFVHPQRWPLTSVDTSCADFVSVLPVGGASPAANDSVSAAKFSSESHRPSEQLPQRPLRGNWPFTVRPPARKPEVPTLPSSVARRSFLPIPAVGSRRTTLLAFIAAEASGNAPASVVKRVSDVRSGRLVLAGRMADVCAELDRMVASEALQA